MNASHSDRKSDRRKLKQVALALAPAIAGFLAHPVLAQTLTWDASAASAAAPTDGSGSWNTTTSANWSDGVSDFNWVTGNVAAIGNGGAAGVITIDDLSGSVNASGINFNPVGSGSYTIAAAPARVLALTGAASMNFGANVSAEISAPISGSAGLALGGTTGLLKLSGASTFSGGVQINSGTIVVGSGGNLGATSNLISLGTPNTGTSTNDPVGALVIDPGASVPANAFKASTNNAASGTIVIGSGASLNITSNSALSGLNSSTNAAFIVGSSNLSAPITTMLTISGGGALNVSGGSNNSSFLVGIGNTNTSANNMIPTLDMSGLANFSFTTGTGAAPGNEFAVGHGSSANATATLAATNTVVAGTIDVGDTSVTPGLTGSGPNVTSSPNNLNLGSVANTLRANTIIIGNVRSIGNVQFAGGTGTLLITGAAGGASTANFIIGTCSSGTPASTASRLTLDDHDVTVQAGTVVAGNMAGGTGGTSNTKGGSISFNTGVFNVADLVLAQGTSGTSGGSICGTFTVGSSANSTGVLNVTNSFKIGAATGGAALAKGTLNVRGGTANISSNIIDVSTVGTSNTTVSLTGGTLNMNGFAIGPKVVAGNTGAVGTRNITTISLPTNSAVLMNLGGTGINDAGLNMNSTGVLIMEGSNGYIGGTTITSGVLQVGQASDTLNITLPLGAAAAGVTNNANLSFASSQGVTVPNVVSGPGGVNQIGSGSTTTNANNTYTGVTSAAGGTLRATNLPNALANSSIGASGSAASNLLITGGTLQYVGAGQSTDRLFTVTATGGAIDGSGGGPISFTNGGSIVSADPGARATTTSTATARVTLPTVAGLLVGMSVTGANIPGGTTITSINLSQNSIVLSNTPSIAGPDTFTFTTADRTLTLTGPTGGSIAGSLSNSAGGAKLGLQKSGSGQWTLSGSNSYTGNTTISGGTLQLNGANSWSPVLNGPGTTEIRGSALLFDYNDGSSDPATTVKGLLTTAYATGFTTLTDQIHSSTATASIGLGWRDDVAGKQVTVLRTLYGDADLNLTVDTVDFNLLAANFSQSGKVWFDGDFNYDGSIDTLDFNLLAANFSQSVSASTAASLGALVPEPASAVLVIVGASLGLRRRRMR